MPDVTIKKTIDDVEAGKTYVALRAEPLLAWDQTKLSTFLDLQVAFERKAFELSKKTRDPDFWKAGA